MRLNQFKTPPISTDNLKDYKEIATRNNILPSPTNKRPMQVHSLNHCSRETDDVQRMVDFYCNILGFLPCSRPPLDFEGSWLYIPNSFYPRENENLLQNGGTPPPGSVLIHIIQKHHQYSPIETPLKICDCSKTSDFPNNPEAVSKSHHLALRVHDITEAEQVLMRESITYYKTTLPGTNITQIFFFDVDGNGIELCDCDLTQPIVIQPRTC